MSQLKNYTGSVYGGLGHLLATYCEAKNLALPEQLQKIQNLERFDYVIWRDLLEDLNRLHPRTGLGLEIAAYVQPKHLGIIAYLALSCENLGEAMACYQDFHRLIYDGSPLYVAVEGENLCFGWVEMPIELTTQLSNEVAMALIIQFMKHFVAHDDIQLSEVHFTHPAPKNTALYEQYFNCKVRFSQSRPMMMIPLSELSMPFQQGDQTLQKLLLQQAEALLEKLPNSTHIDQRLQHAILTGLQKNQYQIEHIARQLNFSVRQLQRYLQQQGTTYQQRMQEVRRILAEQYLKDPHLSLQEIALLLSYSEQSAFQRAFKHWTQVTPQQWRIQHFH